MRAAGIDNVLALRGDPPAGQEDWRKTEGGLEYSRELVRTDRRRLSVRDRRRVLPGDAHPRGQPRGRPGTPRREGGGRRRLPDHAAVLRQRAVLRLRRSARARPAIDVPIIPGIMPITQVGQVERMAKLCKASIPDGLRRELHARAEDSEAVLDFGVAYATLQCAELLERRGRPASTSSRSTDRPPRARSCAR